MDLNSPFFDRIRIRPSCDEPRRGRGAGLRQDRLRAAGLHRAPKGRGARASIGASASTHVREYNASYNYFAGMSDDAVAAYQKDAVDRPPSDLADGRQRRGRKAAEDARGVRATGPMSTRSASCAARASTQAKRAAAEAPKRRYSGVVQRALDTLGLDESADGPAIKAQYKVPGEAVPPRRPWRRPLVRGPAARHHPGARHAEGGRPVLRPTVRGCLPEPSCRRKRAL